MNTLILVCLIIAWIDCGILSYGMGYAYWQRAWPKLAERHRRIDSLLEIVTAILGPIGLAINILWILLFSMHGFQGFKYR